MAILVTGGAGFIGSHTVVELQNAGYDVVVVISFMFYTNIATKLHITSRSVAYYMSYVTILFVAFHHTLS